MIISTGATREKGWVLTISSFTFSTWELSTCKGLIRKHLLASKEPLVAAKIDSPTLAKSRATLRSTFHNFCSPAT